MGQVMGDEFTIWERSVTHFDVPFFRRISLRCCMLRYVERLSRFVLLDDIFLCVPEFNSLVCKTVSCLWQLNFVICTNVSRVSEGILISEHSFAIFCYYMCLVGFALRSWFRNTVM